MNLVLKARKRLINRLVREIVDLVWAEKNCIVDEDKVEQIVAIWLPLTYAESEAEFIATIDTSAQRPPGKGSCTLNRLRAVLGYDKSVSLIGMLEGAADFIELVKTEKEVAP